MLASRCAAVALLVVVGCGGWSKRDTLLELASVAANGVDAMETRGVIADKVETNPIMGPSGDRVPLVVFAPTMMVLHLAVSMAIPAGWMRTTWQGAGVALESAIVARNWSLGYGPMNSDGLKR